MSPFEPLGERARWRIIYDLLVATPVGEVLTYEQMADKLELDAIKDRHTMQVSVRRASAEFLHENGHAIEPVPTVGYRVVEAAEHLRLARNHQRRSSRELVRSRDKIVHVDMAALDPTLRQAFGVVAQALSAQMVFCRNLDIRQRELEANLQAIRTAHQRGEERTAEELAKMRERLERLERERE